MSNTKNHLIMALTTKGVNCMVCELYHNKALLCLEGVPDLPVAPQDEAGLTKTFQTWPRGWFHIP